MEPKPHGFESESVQGRLGTRSNFLRFVGPGVDSAGGSERWPTADVEKWVEVGLPSFVGSDASWSARHTSNPGSLDEKFEYKPNYFKTYIYIPTLDNKGRGGLLIPQIALESCSFLLKIGAR